MVILLILAVLLLAYSNGANDNFKAVATLYGSRTFSYRASLALATIAQLCGSIGSVLLAGVLVKAFGGKGLVPAEIVSDPSFLLAVAGGGAVTVLIATRVGMPISTTHALVGGLVGAGLALAPASFVWSGLSRSFVVPLLLSPVIAVAAAACFYPALSKTRRLLRIDPATTFCVRQAEPAVALASTTAMRSSAVIPPPELAICRYEGCVAGVSAQAVVNTLHVISGFAMGFARGLNDTPKVLALLVAAAWTGIAQPVALTAIALIMAAGGVIHARRLARTLGERITTMNTGQGMLANLVASSLVIGASTFGMPVSTTHVSTGAIFGIGVWTGTADTKVIGTILSAWVLTLPTAAALAYVIATIA